MPDKGMNLYWYCKQTAESGLSISSIWSALNLFVRTRKYLQNQVPKDIYLFTKKVSLSFILTFEENDTNVHIRNVNVQKEFFLMFVVYFLNPNVLLGSQNAYYVNMLPVNALRLTFGANKSKQTGRSFTSRNNREMNK